MHTVDKDIDQFEYCLLLLISVIEWQKRLEAVSLFHLFLMFETTIKRKSIKSQHKPVSTKTGTHHCGASMRLCAWSSTYSNRGTAGHTALSATPPRYPPSIRLHGNRHHPSFLCDTCCHGGSLRRPGTAPIPCGPRKEAASNLHQTSIKPETVQSIDTRAGSLRH